VYKAYLNLTLLISLLPPGKDLIVMYTPGSSSSTHSLSGSLALLIDKSPERSASLEELLLIEAAIDDISVFAALMVETFGVEFIPFKSY
jgi:hypothetical protein